MNRLGVAILGCLLATSGCATIVHGRYEVIEVASTRPAKAEVLVDGVSQGLAPVKATVQADQNHTIVVRAPGHADATIRTERTFQPGYLILDILFGIVWIAVDAGTGSWYTAQPNPMNVWLQPIGGPPVASQQAAPAGAVAP
jgi:hypothetical protein